MEKTVGKMRIVIDTCVMIDFATNRDEHLANQANLVLASGCLGKCECLITANSVTDIFYIVHHLSHNKTESIECLQTLLSYVEIIDVNSDDCFKAFDAKIPDYEDSILIQSAKRHKADYIITDNLKDYTNSPIPAVNAEAFLKLLFAEGNESYV